jgi:hypothetical protein
MIKCSRVKTPTLAIVEKERQFIPDLKSPLNLRQCEQEQKDFLGADGNEVIICPEM